MTAVPGQDYVPFANSCLVNEEASTPALSISDRQGEMTLGQDMVPQLFERHVQRDPSKIAICCGTRSYTYAQVNKTVNRLARSFVSKHPEAVVGTVVGLILSRDEKLVFTILALWKIGLAYIPIDPKSPVTRTQYLLQNADVRLVVTTHEINGLLPHADRNIKFEDVDALLNDEDHADTNLEIDVQGESLAYIIYTSGSTGVPKGALIEHIGVLNNIMNKVNDFEIVEESRVAQVASQSFDISVWQMFIALTQGGTTVIFDDSVVYNIDLFLELLRDSRITTLEIVPSYLAILLEHLNDSGEHPGLDNLNFLILTGEVADAAAMLQWLEHFPRTKIANAYGPTEASDDITHLILSGQTISNPVSIGAALANFTVAVVDEALNPVPIGTKGEIVVSGVGVGRGYVNLEAETFERFVPSPFPDRYRGRLYRTGDIGSMNEDHTFMFHGRKDNQIKLRGFRVELEEIEMKLRESEDVRDCAVVAISMEARDAILTAFVVPYRTVTKKELTNMLEARVPQYMIPTHFAFLDDLPRLSNGKVERAALERMALQTISSPR